jgi:four helix bundle protein
MATLRRHTLRTQQPHERFQAWVAAHELALQVYHLTRSWPSEERLGLVHQARRAGFSVAANICEGSARPGPREFRRFLGLSLGSLAELSYILRLANDLGYLRADERTELEILRDHTHRLTWGLFQAIGRSIRKT